MAVLLGVLIGLGAALPLVASRRVARMDVGLAAVFASFLLFHACVLLVWKVAPAELVPCVAVATFVFLGSVVLAVVVRRP